MSSDEDCYDYYDEDDEMEEGLVADEDDHGLLEDAEAVPRPEPRGDHWVSGTDIICSFQSYERTPI